jgi:hypothetical protein
MLQCLVGYLSIGGLTELVNEIKRVVQLANNQFVVLFNVANDRHLRSVHLEHVIVQALNMLHLNGFIHLGQVHLL